MSGRRRDARSARQRPTDPSHRPLPSVRLGLAAAVVLAAIGVALLWVVRAQLTDAAERNVAAEAEALAAGAGQSLRLAASAPGAVDPLPGLTSTATSVGILEAAVIAPSGTTLFATDEVRIGTEALTDEHRRAATGTTAWASAAVGASGTKVLRTSVPLGVAAPRSPVPVLEVSTDYARVDAQVRDTLIPVAAIVGAGLLIVLGAFLLLLGRLRAAVGRHDAAALAHEKASTIWSREAQAVATIAARAATETELSGLESEAVSLTARALGLRRVAIAERSSDGDLLVRAISDTAPGSRLVAVDGTPSELEWSLAESAPLVARALDTERRITPSALADGATSVAVVPIDGPDRAPAAVLAAYSTQATRFDAREVRFLSTVAHLLAAAISRLALAQEAHEARERLAISRQVEVRLRQAQLTAADVDNLLAVIGEGAESALQSEDERARLAALHRIGNNAARARELTELLLSAGVPAPESGATPPARPMSAILVGPEDPATLLARETLSSHGFSVIDAEGLVDAERIAARLGDRLGLLVTWVDLPDGSGTELAGRLQARDGVAVVLLSDDPATLAPVDGLHPATVVLQTPVSSDALIRSVSQILPAVTLAA